MRVWRVAKRSRNQAESVGHVTFPPLGVLARYPDEELRFPSIWVLLFHKAAFSGSVTSILRSVILSRAASLVCLVEQLYVQMTSNFHRTTSYPFRICHVNDSCQLRDLPGYLLVLKGLYKLNLIVKFELRRDSHTTDIQTYIFYEKQKSCSLKLER